MTYNGHGGGCCGYAHLFGLDGMTLADFDRAVDEHFAPGGNTTNNNRVLEVVLSQRQVTPDVDGRRRHASIVEAGGWPAVLASRGFVLSAMWRNSNSGNNCYQFLKTTAFLPNTDLPFTWTGGRIEQQQPPVVEMVQRPFRPALGDYVRATRGVHAGHVGRVTAAGTVNSGVEWEIGGTGTSRAIPNEFLEPVQVVDTPAPWRREDGFPPPAPVNLDLPVELVSETGEAHSASITSIRPGRVTAVSLSVTRHVTSDNRDLRTPYYYDTLTGEWVGSAGRTVGRLRNCGPAIIHRPGAPAPVPTTTLTEFFAHFQSGRRSGPYETMEALREANPRVLSFVTRRILSNGTVETDEPARILR